MPNASDPRSDRIGTTAPFDITQPRIRSGTILESLSEVREVLRDIDARGWEKARPQGGPGAFFPGAAKTHVLLPAAPARASRGASRAPVPSAPQTPPGAAALNAVPAAPAVPLPRRNGATRAMLRTAGLVVLSAASLMVVQRTDLARLAAGALGKSPFRIGGVSEAARAALPPAVTSAIAQSHAAAAALPAATRTPKPLPVAYEGPTPTQPRPAAASAKTAPVKPHPIAPAAGAPSPLTRGAADRALGKSLRQAGDAKLLEGDVASARLFYKRAADTGDARAALDLGNSFNPAFLDLLGVLGMRGDSVAAAQWYRRAQVLGDPDAETALRTLPR